MNYSETEPMWVKFAEASEFVFVGKDVIATASGIYVHFFNLKSRFERIEQFDSEDRGDGATCLAGHPVVPVLSVAEAKSNPSITLFAYPSMRRIACCPSDGKTNAYLHCTFAGSDYLISQTTFPDFRMIVWKWRSGEKIAQIASKITEVDRKVISCPSNSHAVANFSQIAGELEVHRLLVCSRSVRLCPIEITRIPKHKLTSACWSSDAKLYACDEEGSIYWLNFDIGDCARVITGSHATSTGESPAITSFRAGILLASVDANVRNQVTFVRKSTDIGADDWRIIWTVSLPCHPRWMACPANEDAIILRGDDNQMILVTPPIRDRSSCIEALYNHGRKYTDLCATSIDDRHVGVLDNNSRFSILDVFTGNPISPKLNLGHHVLGMESHRSLPLVATCSNEGNCLLIDMNLPASPKIKKCFHLQREVVDSLKFSKGGTILGVSGSEVPRLFLISGNQSKTNQSIHVIGFIELEAQVTDFLIYEAGQPDTFGILILTSSAPTENNGVFSRRILVYSCKVSTEFRASPLRSIELPSPFKSLYYAGEGKPEEIIGIPYLSKLLHRIQMRGDREDFVLEEVLPSLHRTRKIHVNTLNSLSYIVTCGDDGFIIVRDKEEPRTVLAIFTSHHRLSSGVNRVTIINDIVISLGENGDLVANRLSDLGKRKKNSEEKRLGENCIISQWTMLISSNLVDEDALIEDETWIDRVIRKSKEAERDKALCIRLSIISDFQELREKVKGLLDSNEKESSDSRVPVSDFDLDKEGREKKIARATLERQRVEKEIEGTIRQQDRATSYLQERFLKPLAVQPLAISRIVGEGRVTNYPLHLGVPEDAEVSASHLLSMKEFCCQYINELNEDNDVKEAEQTVTGWIEEPTMKMTANLLSPPRGYARTLKLNSVIEDCERKVRCQFNDIFNEVRQLKKARIGKIEIRISRLRECISELEQTYEAEKRDGGSSVSADWNREEIEEYDKCLEELERILHRNREKCQSAVSQASFQSIRSYVHSSEQTSLDQVSEVPSNDGFWDDALEKMMDGVLEVRWEDEVKKDVAKPDCLQKDPSRYTKDDLQIVSNYNNKVKNLRIGRRIYKRMLESEFARGTEEIGSSIHDFGKELEDLEKKRIQAERATLRYTLTRIRMIASCRRIARQNHEISRVTNEELSPATKESRRLAEECDLFESAIVELKNKFESLAKKEKQQEAKFRSEFPGLKQPMVEQLFRHYRRRPEIGSISCMSLTFLTELASCIINTCTSEILPRECLDYLRGMDCLDLAPDGLPTQIDSNHWRNMCRLRRAKVETEIKVRSCAAEQAEAEHTLSFFRKMNNTTKNRIIRLKEKLRDLESVLSECKKDSEIGLVLKVKQVEIPLSGDPLNTANAVLVLQEEVVQGNNAIINAGEKKLATLEYSIDLQKEVLREEWRHACMKTRMNNLREYLEDVRGTKITRTVLECSRELGTSLASRMELEKIEENLKESRKRLKRKLEEEKTRLDEATNQIELWRERNCRLTSLIENYESECKSMLVDCGDTRHLREKSFRRRNLQAISKELILSRRIQENREELLTLFAHLEICKLRTYPTLRFKQ